MAAAAAAAAFVLHPAGEALVSGCLHTCYFRVPQPAPPIAGPLRAAAIEKSFPAGMI